MRLSNKGNLIFFMKKLFLCFTFLFFLAGGAFCEKCGIIFTPSFGLTFTDHGEYIFSPSGKRLYSYLEWKAEPLFQIGLETSFIFKYFDLTLGGNFGISRECGQMFDSDWVSSGIKTTYSIHKNDAAGNFDLYAVLGFKIPIKKITFTPELALWYYYDYFHAHDGYGWYGGEAYSKNGEDNPWNSIYARKAKKLYPVDLTRKTFDFMGGLKISYAPVKNLSITAGTYIILCTKVNNYDYHYAKPDSGNDFSIKEIQKSINSRFKETLCLSYAFGGNYIVSLSASYLFGGIIQGELYDDDELTIQKSGSDIYSFNVKLSFGLILQ